MSVTYDPAQDSQPGLQTQSSAPRGGLPHYCRRQPPSEKWGDTVTPRGLGENPHGTRDAARKQLLGRAALLLLHFFLHREMFGSVLAKMLTTVYLQETDMPWSSALHFSVYLPVSLNFYNE